MLSGEEMERLIVSIEANTDRFDKAIAGTNARLDAMLGKMEKRADRFQVTFDKAMAGAGRSMRRVMEGIGIELSFEGLKSFVEHVTETAMNVRKQSAAIGVSAETFQAWSIMAQKADVDQQVFNSTLERMTANIGKAQLKTTDFGRTLSTVLKMPYQKALAGSPEDVIYRIADAIEKIGPVMQRADFLRMASGSTGGGGSGGGVALAQFFGQGAASMKARTQALISSGEVMSDETVGKLQRLDKAWIDIKATLETGGANLLTGFVDGFQQLSGVVTDQKFQDGLREIGKLLADITYAVATGTSSVARFAGGFEQFLLKDVLIPSAKYQLDQRAYEGFKEKLKVLQTEENNQAHITPYQADYGDGGGRYIVSSAKSDKDKTNLADSLDQKAYEKAVDALKLRTAALRDGTGEFANYTAAQEAARVKVELMTAAEEDAAKKNAKVTSARVAEINRLAQAWGVLAAAKKFAKDLTEENDRIAKLKAEAAAAGATSRALAELETRETLLAKFHADHGPGKEPGPEDMAAINSASVLSGSAAAGADWSKAVDSAQKEIGEAQARNSTIGLFGPQLAESEMRLKLINQAMVAGQPLTADVMKQIGGLSSQYGQLAQAAYTTTESFDRQLDVTNQLRDGLSGIATAGLHGFNSMKSAAASFMEQLAALILKLYVMQPLLEKSFGPPGTAGGGSMGGFLTNLLSSDPLAPVTVTPAVTAASANGIGDFFANMFNFAGGGVMTASGPRKLKRFAGGGLSSSAAIFGEAGPEAAVPLPDGHNIPVNLRMPRAPVIPQFQPPLVNVTYAPVNHITGNDPSTVAQVRSLLQTHEQNMPAMIHNTVNQMARRKAGPWNG